MGRVDGKVAIVTGAARGTGEQTARLLADEGAKVVVADILEAEGRTVAEEIGAAARFERLDVTDERNWAELVEATTARFARPRFSSTTRVCCTSRPFSRRPRPTSSGSGA